jgi:hypothetical protein
MDDLVSGSRPVAKFLDTAPVIACILPVTQRMIGLMALHELCRRKGRYPDKVL